MELLPAFNLTVWTYRAHPATKTILAQEKAKKNLDFGKRAQKKAMLSGGVAAIGCFQAPWKDNATKSKKSQAKCGLFFSTNNYYGSGAREKHC